MSLAQLLDRDLGTFFNLDHFAETVTYLPPIGGTIQVTAIVDRDVWAQQRDDEGDREQHDAQLAVPTSVAAGIDHAGKFTIGSEQFWITGELSRDAQCVVYSLSRVKQKTLKNIYPEKHGKRGRT